MKILFIPGSGAGKEVWTYQTRYFADSEGIALPGHPDGEPCTSIDGYVEWLRGYIRQKGYKDVVLAGHSLGGGIAQLYGLKYGNELKALILLGTGARLRVRPDILESVKSMIGNDSAWRKYLEDSHTGWPDSEIAKIELEARMKIGPAVLLNDFLCCDKFDIMDKVQNIKLPTLVLCGTEDVMTPVKYARYLADKVAGSTTVIIDGGTHMVFIEKPKEVNQAIEKFLASLS
jgi:pimeloyl-ACP methyl ester carboxylesterase